MPGVTQDMLVGSVLPLFHPGTSSNKSHLAKSLKSSHSFRKARRASGYRHSTASFLASPPTCNTGTDASTSIPDNNRASASALFAAHKTIISINSYEVLLELHKNNLMHDNNNITVSKGLHRQVGPNHKILAAALSHDNFIQLVSHSKVNCCEGSDKLMVDTLGCNSPSASTTQTARITSLVNVVGLASATHSH